MTENKKNNIFNIAVAALLVIYSPNLLCQDAATNNIATSSKESKDNKEVGAKVGAKNNAKENKVDAKKNQEDDQLATKEPVIKSDNGKQDSKKGEKKVNQQSKSQIITRKSDSRSDKIFRNIEKNRDVGLVAKYKDWNVYEIKEKNYRACYAISIPYLTKGNKIKRAQPYFVVNNMINDADEVYISSGFIYKKNQDIEISINQKKFYLLSYRSLGWTYSKNDDIDIIKAMQEGEDLKVTSLDEQSRINIDNYSLIGFRKAYFKLKKLCKDDI